VQKLTLKDTLISEIPYIECLENLKHLDLTNNLIGWEGCWRIAYAMKEKHITLEHLNLDSN